MKTTINKAKQDFDPININIRIETKKELKAILLMASALSEIDAIDQDHLENSGISLRAFPNTTEYVTPEIIVDTINKMFPTDMWNRLDQIYDETINKS